MNKLCIPKFLFFNRIRKREKDCLDRVLSRFHLRIVCNEKKGRTKAELHQIIEWLTSFDETKIQELINEQVTFETFFEQATLHFNAHLIKGMICGYRIEEVDNSLTQQVRYLDKLVDELAKGRKMDKILRKEKSNTK